MTRSPAATRVARLAFTAAALMVPLVACPNTITITDVNFGAPSITTDLSGRAITTSSSAFVRALTGGSVLPVGKHSVLLSDGLGNNISDFLVLNVSARVHGLQQVSLLFESESAPDFAATVAALRHLPGTTTTRETPGLLDLSGLLDSGNLSIRLDSGPRSVPDHGSTAVLLGAALIGTCVFARRTKFAG